MASPAEAVTATVAADSATAASTQSWRSGPIHINVATSFSDDTPRQIDLASTIGHKTCCPRAGKRNDASCFWLPSNLDQNVDTFRQRRVHPMFVRACHAAGFLIHGCYNNQGNCIQFQCNRANFRLPQKAAEYQAKRKRNVIDPSKPPGKRPNRKSSKPSREKGDVCCRFKFCVYWDAPSRRWFVPKQQRGCAEHCGHEYVDPRQLPLQARFTAPEEEWDAGGDGAAGVSGTSATDGIAAMSDDAAGKQSNEGGQATIDDDALEPANSGGARRECMEMFASLCEMAEANGPQGRRALWNGLGRIRDELAALGGQGERRGRGLVEHPV